MGRKKVVLTENHELCLNELIEASTVEQSVFEKKETELVVTTESAISKAQTKDLNKYSKIIRDEMSKVENSFIKVGYALHQVYNENLFELLGYKNIYAFAKNEFNIARGTCNNFIHIIEKFGKRDEKGNAAGEIADDFKSFKSSQLIVMLGMNSEELKKIESSMSVRDIKALKDDVSCGSTSDSENIIDSTSIDIQEETNQLEEINSNLIAEIASFEEIAQFQAVIEKILSSGRKVQIIEIL